MLEQGKRTDLASIKEEIDGGATLIDLYDGHFETLVKYERGIHKYINLKARNREGAPEVIILYGDSGTGKTRYAFDFDPDLYQYMGESWFDGYYGQATALFDEFDGSDMAFNLWKKVTDRYRLRVRIKTDSTNWAPKTIIFTTNTHPRLWWGGKIANSDFEWNQFARRITKFVVYEKDKEPMETELTRYVFSHK